MIFAFNAFMKVPNFPINAHTAEPLTMRSKEDFRTFQWNKNDCKKGLIYQSSHAIFVAETMISIIYSNANIVRQPSAILTAIID